MKQHLLLCRSVKKGYEIFTLLAIRRRKERFTRFSDKEAEGEAIALGLFRCYKRVCRFFFLMV